jgi:hypothetical protein
MPSRRRSKLIPGERVEVRDKDEILATLDRDGCLDGMPFMPEMLRYCGKQFTIYKRADKTCDTIEKTGGRRLYNTVHLDGVRCDGSAHGGCQATCLIFWNESWLKRAGQPTNVGDNGCNARTTGCTESDLARAAEPLTAGEHTERVYRCQATQLLVATKPLAWWDIRQYARDLACGNVTPGRVLKSFTFAGFRMLFKTGIGHRAMLRTYDWFQSLRGKSRYPYLQGTLTKTPAGVLDLKPGELVRVKPYKDILATLNTRNRNQGLYFDGEMVRFCGGTYRVEKRVNQILNEKTGQMMHFANPCIILQDVYCRSELSDCRLFCPRAIYPYWREIWLERVNLVVTDVNRNSKPSLHEASDS